MFSGAGIIGTDGTEWYFPQRLTDDTAAVANGNANPAQTRPRRGRHHGTPSFRRACSSTPSVPAWVGPPCAAAAQQLAQQSGIPMSNLTLANYQSTYAHNDPAGAYPTTPSTAG